MKLYFDNTYGRIRDPHWYSAIRIASIPGLLPMNFYYVGQTRTPARNADDTIALDPKTKQPALVEVKHDNAQSVYWWALEHKGKNIPVIIDNESNGIETTPWDNPNLEKNLDRLYAFMSWYRQVDPAVKFGSWYSMPPATGNPTNQQQYLAFEQKLATLHKMLSYTVSELYHPGPMSEWLAIVAEHAKATQKYDLENIAVLEPAGRTPSEIELQVRSVAKAGFEHCVFWMGNDNPGWKPDVQDKRTGIVISGDQIEAIARCVKLYA